MSSSIYAFNIVAEAKIRTLVVLTKKYHPDWSKEQIENFLNDAVSYAVQKELSK